MKHNTRPPVRAADKGNGDTVGEWWRRLDQRYPRTLASTLGTAAGVTTTLAFGWWGGVAYLCGAFAVAAACAMEVRDDD